MRRHPLLASRPITTSVLFTVVGAFPLFLVAAQSVRLQDELGFGTAQLGYAVSGFFVTAALTSLSLGSVIDRIGPTAAFRIAGVAAAISALVIGALANDWVTVAAGLGFSGIANAFGQLGANLAIADRVRSERQGVAFGAKQAAVPLGSLAAGLVVSTVGIGIDWRITFLVHAALSVGLAFLAPRLAHDARPPEERLRLRDAAVGPLVPLLLAAALGSSAANSLAVLLVDAFVTAGFTPRTAAFVLAVGSAASIAARVTTGWYVDRNQTGGFPELAGLMFSGTVGFLLLGVAGGNRAVLLLGVLFGFAAGWGYPAVIYYVAVRVRGNAPAAATGFVLTGTYAGTMIGPPLLASLAEARSYSTAWLLGAALMGIGGAMVLTSRRRSVRGPRELRGEETR